MAVEPDEVVDILAGMVLFADLPRPQLEEVSHSLEEEWFTQGQRVLRQGFTGSGIYFIVDGEVAVEIDGSERARLGRGDYFGEVSMLLGEPPTADVVAAGPLRCLVLAEPDAEGFLKTHPTVMYRMMQSQARRLRQANLWRG
ncbi:MAG TPA: cyclic nucleotide-binding domain-containing protein [Actinomycetota bacterium]